MARSKGLDSKHTEDADQRYLHGSAAEVANRLYRGGGGDPTVTNFSQIGASTRSGRSGIADRSGKVVKNGKLGGDLRHSGD